MDSLYPAIGLANSVLLRPDIFPSCLISKAVFGAMEVSVYFGIQIHKNFIIFTNRVCWSGGFILKFSLSVKYSNLYE